MVAHRGLARAPAGRIGISDVVADDSLTTEERAERGSWVGCVAGALPYSEYRHLLEQAGFVEITIQATTTRPPTGWTRPSSEPPSLLPAPVPRPGCDKASFFR